MTRADILRQSRRSRRNDEHRLQVAVMQVIQLAGVKDLIAFCVPNGLVSNAVSVARMKSAGLLPGVADLALVLPGGQAVFIELKAPKGTQTPDQLAFQAACEANGTRYFVASTLDDAITILTTIGALRLDKVRGLNREPTREAAA